MMEEKELADLLRKTAGGDHGAFQRLYQETSGRLYGVALNMMRRRDWADEVMQEAYVKIWHNAAAYHSERGNVLTWMISILRYRALDRLRRHEPLPLDEDYLASRPDEDTPGPLQQLVTAGEQLALYGCMEQLSGDQRKSIQLAFLEGISHADLANRLRVPLGTVKSWIRRGLVNLRRCLEP